MLVEGVMEGEEKMPGQGWEVGRRVGGVEVEGGIDEGAGVGAMGAGRRRGEEGRWAVRVGHLEPARTSLRGSTCWPCRTWRQCTDCRCGRRWAESRTVAR